MDGQRQQVAERREKQQNKAIKLSLCGWKVGTKKKKRIVWCLRGVISAKRSPNGLFVTQQTGTHREDSRVGLLFHLYCSVSLLLFVKKISAHSSKDQLSVLIRRHWRKSTAAFRTYLCGLTSLQETSFLVHFITITLLQVLLLLLHLSLKLRKSWKRQTNQVR